MSEELLKVIVQFFAIVAKERITEDERENLREFLAIHVIHGSIGSFMDLFDYHLTEENNINTEQEQIKHTDADTLEFVDDWAKIIKISKQINEALTRQQKYVLILKLIELMLQDGKISERQSNLIYYIGKIIKIESKELDAIKMFLIGQDSEELDTPDFLIIDEGSGDAQYKSKRIKAPNITGMIAILRIPGEETYFIKYLGISVLTLNGVHLKSRKVYVFPTGSTIRGNKINPIYYSHIVSQFLTNKDSSLISFVAKDLSFKFKSGAYGIRNINIAETGGKLIGLMGASGSGKSTLINVLNGTDTPSEGCVLINNYDVHNDKEGLEGVIGFVPQDDFLIEELTVYQNLYYSARLCFGQQSEIETHSLVQKTLKSLGLQETQEFMVGSVLDKTISGGQRKRLNIGLELLRQPSVMFVDEPTSGLSSNDSVNIMDLLKELSLRGKMVFVVIHQPSSDIYKMFDTLLVLDVGGYQIFYGNPVEAVIYFKSIVSMVNKNVGVCIECGNVNSEQIFTIIEAKIVNEYGRFTDKRNIRPELWYEHFKEKLKIPEVEVSKDLISVAQEIPKRQQQFKIFGIRDLLTKMSNKQYLLITFLEAPILAIFLTYLIKYYIILNGQGSYIFSKNDNIPVYFFMSVIVALFMGLTLSAEEIIKDRKILKRESYLNLSRVSYLSSKVYIMFGISAIQTLSYVLIGNYILELNDMYLSLWIVLFATSCFANILGLNISSAFNSAVTVYILIPILLIPQLVLSGVIISFDKFNPKISSLDKVPAFGDVMASRWAFEGLVVDQFKHNDYGSIFYEYDREIALSEYKKVYYVPKLESHVANIANNFSEREDSLTNSLVNKSLTILEREFAKELNIIGWRHFPEYDDLQHIDSLKEDTYNASLTFLSNLKRFYTTKNNTWSAKKDSIMKFLTNSPKKRTSLDALREVNYNEAIAVMLEGRGLQQRIAEDDGGIVQKIYPVYYRPDQGSLFDFRTKFYAPEKQFLGSSIDTLIFNTAVIWLMTITLLFVLYYDLLKKLVDFIGNYRDSRRYKRITDRLNL